MFTLKKPKALQKGDRVALLSPSSGMAGEEDLLFRYEIGKHRLEQDFELRIIEYPTTLAGIDYVYNHPEERARDLMSAFSDPSIKAIFCCIGGEDSIRLLPYIDFQVLQDNPKILMGYSDSTVLHLFCLKAGVSSIYGPSILAEIAENVEIFPYTKKALWKTLFSTEPIGNILPAEKFTRDFLLWTPQNQQTSKTMHTNTPYQLLQGKGIVRGPLLGGCIEVLDFARGTSLFPELSLFQDAILFLETSEENPSAEQLQRWLRTYALLGIFDKINGIIVGKPASEEMETPYKQALYTILQDEFSYTHLPVLFGLNFGHTQPMFCLPYGAMAEINCNEASFSILESAVT